MLSYLPILLFTVAVIPALATNVVTLTTYTTTTICPITETLTSKGRTMTQTRMTTSTVSIVIRKTVVLPGPTSTVTKRAAVNVTQFSTRYISQPATPTFVTLHSGTTKMVSTIATVPKTEPASQGSQPPSPKDLSASSVRSVPGCPGDSSLCPTLPPANSNPIEGGGPAGPTDFSPKPTVEKHDGQSVAASRPGAPQEPIAQSNTQHVPQKLGTEGLPDVMLTPIATAIALPTNAALTTYPPVWLSVALLLALCTTQQ